MTAIEAIEDVFQGSREDTRDFLSARSSKSHIAQMTLDSLRRKGGVGFLETSVAKLDLNEGVTLLIKGCGAAVEGVMRLDMTGGNGEKPLFRSNGTPKAYDVSGIIRQSNEVYLYRR